MKIIVVDDNVIKAMNIESAVRSSNPAIQIISLRYADEVIKRIQEDKIDLIISDMQYSFSAGENISFDCGLKLIEEVRKISNIPIIICSSEHKDVPDEKNVYMVTYHPNSVDNKIDDVLSRIKI